MTVNKIAVAGTGYVGLSLATLLAQHNNVVAVDVIQEKVDLINNKKSPIQDKEIEDFLANKKLNLVATTDGESAYKDADLIIIATPTNYDPKLNFFDTKYVEQVIELVLKVNPNAIMIINQQYQLVILNQSAKNTTQRILFLHQSFYARVRLFMITSTQAALLLALIYKMNALQMQPIPLQNFCNRAQSKRIFQLYTWALPKPKL